MVAATGGDDRRDDHLVYTLQAIVAPTIAPTVAATIAPCIRPITHLSICDNVECWPDGYDNNCKTLVGLMF